MIRRRLFNITSVVSLLVATATGALWLRSNSRRDVGWMGCGRILLLLHSTPNHLSIELDKGFPVFEPFHWVSAKIDAAEYAVYATAPRRAVWDYKDWNAWDIQCEYGPMQVDLDSKGGVLRMNSSPFAIGRSVPMSYVNTTVPYRIILPIFLLLPLCKSLTYLFRRWQVPNHCPTCGYNLTGNTSGICPECGTPVPSKPETVA